VPLSAWVNAADLARELQNLADKPQLTGRRKELRALADDLAAGQDLGLWAEVDLVRAYARPECLEPPPPAATSPARSTAGAGAAPGARRRAGAARGAGGTGGAGRGATAAHRVRAAATGVRWRPLWERVCRVREGALEAALGVMVFVPLLVTWAGLRMAGEAYGELAESDPAEASRPFLQLWQSGFGGHLSPYERFDSVTLTAVGLIAFLVLLAVWHAWVRSRTDREEEAREADDRAVLGALTSVLTRAQLLLAEHKYTSPQRFAAELTGAAKQLSELTGQAAESHDKLVQAAGTADRAMADLAAATDRLSHELPLLGAAADRIEAAVRSGADALRDAQATATDAVRTAQDSTTRTGQDNVTAVREVGERIAQAGSLMDTAVKELTTVQRELAGLSGKAVQSNDRASRSMVSSADRTGDAADGMRVAAERWDAAAAHWQDAAARLDEGIRRLAGVAPRGPVDAPGPGSSTGYGPGPADGFGVEYSDAPPDGHGTGTGRGSGNGTGGGPGTGVHS
jgi:hypothetical protein